MLRHSLILLLKLTLKNANKFWLLTLFSRLDYTQKFPIGIELNGRLSAAASRAQATRKNFTFQLLTNKLLLGS